MKQFFNFFVFLTIAAFAFHCNAETSDLDLIILQNPKVELKKAAKKGQLEKLVRIIKLIDQKKIDPEIFKDPSLVSKAEKREIKNNRDSKKYLFFKGLLWTSLIATALFPAGASKNPIDMCVIDNLDYYPLLLKGMIMSLELMFLKFMSDGKALWKRDGGLGNQLIKKYHEKSLA